MAVFPTPGMDNNTWGAELNALLEVTLNEDGTPNNAAIAMILGALVAGSNIAIDTTTPYAPVLSATGIVPGYQRLTLTYNGSDPFNVDCLTGAEWDPTVGGVVMGMFPYQMLFGGGPAGDQAVVAYVDNTGNVDTFILLYAGMGTSITAYASDGTQASVNIGLPALEGGSGYVASVVAGSGVSVDDTDPLNPIVSSSGATTLALSYNGTGPMDVEVLNGLSWNPSTGGLLFAILPAALCGLGEDVPAFCSVSPSAVISSFTFCNGGFFYTFASDGSQMTSAFNNDNGQLALLPDGTIVLDTGSYSWAFNPSDGSFETPTGQKLFSAATLADLTGQGTVGDIGFVQNAGSPFFAIEYQGIWRRADDFDGFIQCQAYNATQEVYYTQSTLSAAFATGYPWIKPAYSPHTSEMYPFAVLSAGDCIVVNFGDQQQNDSPPGTIVLSGTLVVWNADGTELMEAAFTLSGIDIDTPNQYLTLTSVRSVGSDLALNQAAPTGAWCIQTTGGGTYNVLLRADAAFG